MPYVTSIFLVSQNVIPSKRSLGGHLPYVFTEQGVAMLSSVLKSKRAIQVNIQIMRAFTKLRRMLATNEELRRKIKEHDIKFEIVFEAIEELIAPLPDREMKIGFRA